MDRGLMLLVLTILGLLAVPASSTRTGDEGYSSSAPNVTGTFYAFADKAIHVINPATRKIIKNITTDNNGKPLTNVGAIGGAANKSRSWNDPVYMEDSAKGLRYIFINEGDVYQKPNGEQVSYVTVIDTYNDTIVGRVEVGPNPVHIYGVNLTKEIWTHPDKSGDFYVISLGDLSNTTKVPGLVRKAGHGKLLVEEDLMPRAYGTNVNEQFVFEFDLVKRNRTGAYNFTALLPPDAACFGTHSIAYSKFNQHAYIECIGKGVLEWNTKTNELVLFWPEGGHLVAAPGDDYILLVDKANSRVTILRPTVNGQPSELVSDISVPGNPDKAYFYSPKAGDNVNLTDYLTYFPLTRNTNLNTLKAAAPLAVDITTAAFFTKPSDCKYAETASAGAVKAASADAPALSLAKGASGQVLTPKCGACAPGFNPFDPSQFNGSLSGFRVLNLGSAAPVGTEGTRLVPAGAVLPQKDMGAYGPANECAFAGVYRPAKRGGRFVATVGVIPDSAIYFVEPGKDPYTSFAVRTAPSPKTVTWAPIAPSGK